MLLTLAVNAQRGRRRSIEADNAAGLLSGQQRQLVQPLAMPVQRRPLMRITVL